MAARINQAIDAMIQRWANGLAPNDTTTFSRPYLRTITDAEFVANVSTIAGRQVFAVPLDYSQLEFASRSDDLNQKTVGVLIVERYMGADIVPDTWIDDQVEWVEKQIYDPLQNMRRDPLLGSLWSHNVTVTTICDDEKLRSKKLFWSELIFEFHEVVRG